MTTEDVFYRFPGVFSFEDNALSSQLFSGRNEDGYKLLQYILSENLTVLFATSGYGKTSILQAYVFRKLREHLYYPVIVRLNITDTLNDTDASPQRIIKARFREIEKQPDFDFIEQDNDGSLKSFFNAIEIWQGIKLLTPVVVFDQFEEIFTLEHNSKYRDSFFEELAVVINACREGKMNMKIVISIREDMLGKLEKMAHLIPSIFINRFQLKPLSKQSAAKAITEPAEKLLMLTNGTTVTPAFCFSEDAKDDLLMFLSRKKEEGGWKQTNEVEPIQLQIICRELEERATEKWKLLEETEKIEIKCKDLKGDDETVADGLQHILGGFYDKQISKLKTELNLGEHEIQSIRNMIETDLIAGNKRVPIDYDALIKWENISKKGVDLLINNRLLKREEYGDNSLVEISHDTLIEPILKSYEARKLQEEAVANAEKANKLYERLLRKAKEKLDLSSDELKALQKLVEKKLVTNHKRAVLHKREILAQPNMRPEAIDLFIKEQLLSINAESEVEIYSDAYLDSIAKLQQIRYAEEEKAAREIELAVQKEKIEANKKRLQRNAVLVIIIFFGALFYIINLNNKNSTIEQMAMLFKANGYFEKGDLKKAFSIYGILYKKDDEIIKKQLDSLKFDYTDIPGSTVKALANSHILSQLNDTTFQIWKIVSSDSIYLDTTFTNIRLVRYSIDYSHFAIYTDNKLMLYNSDKDADEETVLLNNVPGDKEPYFTFSKYNNYFSYYQNDTVHTMSMDNDNEITYKWKEGFNSLLKNLIYISGSVLYAYYDDNIYGWMNNGKDSFELDGKLGLVINKTPWISIGKGNIMYGMSKGLASFNLLDSKVTLVEKGIFFKDASIEKPSENMAFLYESKYFSDENRDKDYNLSFYNLSNGLLNRPFGSDTIEHLSVNVDYTKCLIGNRSKDVYLVDNNFRGKTKLSFLKDANAYDISDDGNNILFVKEEKKQTTDAADAEGEGKKVVSYLYSYSLADTSTNKAPQLIDAIYMDPNVEDSTSIYAKYYFRFSSDSKMFAYTQEKSNSTFFVVRNLTNNNVVFSSSKIEKSLDDGNKKDFTSYYVHVQSKDGKEGVVLLNGKQRNVSYFSKLYPALTDDEYKQEVKNLHLDL